LQQFPAALLTCFAAINVEAEVVECNSKYSHFVRESLEIRPDRTMYILLEYRDR